MKKLICLIFIAVVIVSCVKKNDPITTPASDSSLVVGAWKDGPETDNYYTNGKLVYTVTIQPTTPSTHTYQFNTDGSFIVSALQSNGTYSTVATYSFALTDSNTFLHYSTSTFSTDKPISFIDKNTFVLTSTNTSGVTYIDGSNVTHNADSETVLSTLVRQ